MPVLIPWIKAAISGCHPQSHFKPDSPTTWHIDTSWKSGWDTKHWNVLSSWCQYKSKWKQV